MCKPIIPHNAGAGVTSADPLVLARLLHPGHQGVADQHRQPHPARIRRLATDRRIQPFQIPVVFVTSPQDNGFDYDALMAEHVLDAAGAAASPSSASLEQQPAVPDRPPIHPTEQAEPGPVTENGDIGSNAVPPAPLLVDGEVSVDVQIIAVDAGVAGELTERVTDQNLAQTQPQFHIRMVQRWPNPNEDE